MILHGKNRAVAATFVGHQPDVRDANVQGLGTLLPGGLQPRYLVVWAGEAAKLP